MFYKSLCVAVAICRLSYFSKHEKNKDRRATCKDLVEYCYLSIKDEKKIKKIKNKIRCVSYFKEETGFNNE